MNFGPYLIELLSKLHVTSPAGTDRQRKASPDDLHPAGEAFTDGVAGTEARRGGVMLNGFNPELPVFVVPSSESDPLATIKQFDPESGRCRWEKRVEGPTPEVSDRRARRIADELNRMEVPFV